VTAAWRASTDFATVCRRASGRRRYNATCRFQAVQRRARLLKLFRFQQGDVGRAAEALGVSRMTVWRDMQALGMHSSNGCWRSDFAYLEREVEALHHAAEHPGEKIAHLEREVEALHHAAEHPGEKTRQDAPRPGEAFFVRADEYAGQSGPEEAYRQDAEGRRINPNSPLGGGGYGHLGAGRIPF